MPTHIRAQCCWQVDSMLPRDASCINPAFRHQADISSMTGPDWQTLADDLAAGINTIAGGSRQLTVKLYEIKDPVPGNPNRPMATKITNANSFQATTYPGEIALCLSFNGGPNGPSNRGRLYLPWFCIASTAPGNRPSGTNRTAAGAFVPVFAGLGGANVDWIVWSPTRKAATRVERWFVDDEFDTQRRRGLKMTARTTGVTSG